MNVNAAHALNEKCDASNTVKLAQLILKGKLSTLLLYPMLLHVCATE